MEIIKFNLWCGKSLSLVIKRNGGVACHSILLPRWGRGERQKGTKRALGPPGQPLPRHPEHSQSPCRNQRRLGENSRFLISVGTGGEQPIS
ncbi:hypothetical protein JZ751_004477 [Albula glossodonta]|uniref:Uncharacterized protein n=1 Tax=Albula glossodonta TaxID=121402 RepID=A0A8T2N5M2_9TELE|nr:hypothetical protein JZ751_004477 [Albula glossodonta]